MLQHVYVRNCNCERYGKQLYALTQIYGCSYMRIYVVYVPTQIAK